MDRNITYQNLRNEIIFLMQRHDNYHLAAYTATISLWTIAFTKSNPWVALIPMIVLIPISLRMCECRRGIISLALYMRTCLEDETIHDWEYMHHKQEECMEKISGRKKGNFYKISKFAFCFLSLISALIFWFMRESFLIKNNILLTIAMILGQVSIIFIQTWIWYKNIDNKDYSNKIEEAWKYVKNDAASKTKEESEQ